MKLSKVITLIVCLIVPLAVGGFAGVETAQNITTWYVDLVKPWFNPPNYLFGPVWTLLYILMGIAMYLVFWTFSSAVLRKQAIILFATQLLFNFAWSFIFFKYHQLGWALFEIIIMWILIFITIMAFAKVSKVAAWLLVPYISWVSFATILNFAIWRLN